MWRGLVTGQEAHTEYRESTRLLANSLVLGDYEEGTFESWTQVSFTEPGEVPRASGVLHAELPQFLVRSFLGRTGFWGMDDKVILALYAVVAVLKVARGKGW